MARVNGFQAGVPVRMSGSGQKRFQIPRQSLGLLESKSPPTSA
jgi:hypothetical protein